MLPFKVFSTQAAMITGVYLIGWSNLSMVRLHPSQTTSFSQRIEDPAMWGYHPLGNNPFFTVDKRLSDPPFHLHLVGAGAINIPAVLEEVVVVHRDLDYNQYYEVVGKMDICIPAFAGAGNNFIASQASSTVGMCMQVNVSLHG
jgi:hypothetical protein